MAGKVKLVTRKAAANAKLKQIEAEKLAVAKAVATTGKAPVAAAFKSEALFGKYDQYQAGSFENLDHVRLCWTQPDLFELIPRIEKPFAFVRPNSTRIQPTNFFTDGGSIPRFVTAINGRLTPWGYGPAYLIHDWGFDRHHCGDKTSFEEVRDMLMEALKTLMTTVVPKDEIAFNTIYLGVSSPVARAAWNNNPPTCPIPPPKPE